MKVTIQPAKLSGTVRVIASKSAAHRLLIAAALADYPTRIICEELSQDIEATAGALKALGAGISYINASGSFLVVPVRQDQQVQQPEKEKEAFGLKPLDSSAEPLTLDVGESGSTLRFLLPVICALGKETKIVMHGRLPERPLSPLWEELIRHGANLRRLPDGSILTAGSLRGGEFCIAANVSSQFISGLLFAIPLLKGPAWIRLTGAVESKGYILMTIRALEQFGIRTEWKENILKLFPVHSNNNGSIKNNTDVIENTAENIVPCKEVSSGNADGLSYLSPGQAKAEGDWSNGAFWEVAGMLTKGGVICTGLDEDSLQGDRAIRKLKEQIAAGDSTVDCRDVPDLVPVMSVLAAASPGTTVFTHAERLRIKESDRIRATAGMLSALGADVSETEDGLIVRGKEKLAGGVVDSCNDHRIAMSAAVASIACEGEVTVLGAEAVRKSYPGFWDDFEMLGGKLRKEET